MKTKYINSIRTAIITSMLLLGAMTYGQDIHFTFANDQNTSDGFNDYYEIDVMVQTINATEDFKLGTGQLYFNYNTDAFGENISASGGLEASYPNNEGYLCGQNLDAGGVDIYGAFGKNDNIPSKVSWNFSQVFSSSTFAGTNVSDAPTKLVHLKFKYVNVLESPMLLFEDGAIYDDQFFTACGSTGSGAFDAADCVNFAGVQLVNDTFDSSGARLSVPDAFTDLGILVYPNPTSDVITIKSASNIELVELYDLLGKQMLSTELTEQIKVNHLPVGVYILKVYSDYEKVTRKLIIE